MKWCLALCALLLVVCGGVCADDDNGGSNDDVTLCSILAGCDTGRTKVGNCCEQAEVHDDAWQDLQNAESARDDAWDAYFIHFVVYCSMGCDVTGPSGYCSLGDTYWTMYQYYITQAGMAESAHDTAHDYYDQYNDIAWNHFLGTCQWCTGYGSSLPCGFEDQCSRCE